MSEASEVNPVERLVMRILNVTAKHDDYDGLWWRTDGEYAPVTMIDNAYPLTRLALLPC